MTRTIIALYDEFADAQQALRDLETTGISNQDVSVVTHNRGDTTAASGETKAGEGAGVGASIGTVLGGGAALLAGLGVLAIPGIGPIVAAGPLVAALAGAGVGAATGGIVGGLAGYGIPDRDAELYAEGVRRGGSLITVQAPDSMVERIEEILERYDPVDIDERGAEYRGEGWDRFDPTGPGYGGTAMGAATAAGAPVITPAPRTDTIREGAGMGRSSVAASGMASPGMTSAGTPPTGTPSTGTPPTGPATAGAASTTVPASARNVSPDLPRSPLTGRVRSYPEGGDRAAEMRQAAGDKPTTDQRDRSAAERIADTAREAKNEVRDTLDPNRRS